MPSSKPTPRAEEKRKEVAGARIERKIITGTKSTPSTKRIGVNVGESRTKPMETLASKQNMDDTKIDKNNVEPMDQDMAMDVDKVQGNIFFHLHRALENTSTNITNVESSTSANTVPASNVELADQDTEMKESCANIFSHLSKALEKTEDNIADVMSSNSANPKPASNAKMTQRHGNIFSHLQDALERTETNITNVMSANFAMKRPASNVEVMDKDTQMKESCGNIFSHLHSALQQRKVNITEVATTNAIKVESEKIKPASKGIGAQRDLNYEEIASHFRYMASRAKIFRGSSRWKSLR
ncbi:hypothetical protein MFRU_007g03500 [Monilinia fructicola]|uniref:Uncharacterized protein n=1 Tax=Monilinia fructicola TaxID=38448 RepID=A0A5M9JDA0_MONFR|nr:hypothetical protein EYC84_010355 [Monilinia fructicola]KAG4032447.1 hypothetical protein MFRU_007g03500 [Monilinia fructicola]